MCSKFASGSKNTTLMPLSAPPSLAEETLYTITSRLKLCNVASLLAWGGHPKLCLHVRINDVLV